MTPPTKADREERLQKRLNAWATANLNPRLPLQIVRPRLRGREKLIKQLGIERVERIERKARLHLVKRFVDLRRIEGIPIKKGDIPKSLAKEVGQTFRKETVLFTRTKLHVSRVKDSRSQLHWRDTRTGRFTIQPRRRRSR